MKVLVFLSIVLLSFTNFSPLKNTSDKNINLTITNIRSLEGDIKVTAFTSHENFKKKRSALNFIFSKENVVEGTLNTKISIPEEGIYGLALLDDENLNGKMDYKWALPKEGYGFSDYYHNSFSYPKFDSFKFELKKDEVKDIVMKIRYL